MIAVVEGQRLCEHCGERPIAPNGRRFCSIRCGALARAPRVPRLPCRHCGKTLTRVAQVFCNRACLEASGFFDRGADPVAPPTLDEIRERCAEVQAGWTDEVRAQRCVAAVPVELRALRVLIGSLDMEG